MRRRLCGLAMMALLAGCSDPPQGPSAPNDVIGHIVYLAGNPETSIEAIRPDGSDHLILQPGAGIFATTVTVAPDGRSVAFDQATEGGYTQIWVLRVGRSVRAIKQSSEALQSPSWCWGTDRLVFTMTNTGNLSRSIFSARPDGSEQRPWPGIPTGFGHMDGPPTCAPSGDAIVFSADLDIDKVPQQDLWLAPLDGSGLIRLTDHGGQSPTWSPDEQQIAYESGGGIFIVNRDGSGRHELTPGRDPAWSPDGIWIVFAGDTSLSLIHPDGSERHAIPGAPSGYGPAWAPPR